MRVLVTGGTGFVGSNLVHELLQNGHEVLMTARVGEQNISGFTGKCFYPSLIGIDWNAIGKVDVVFHQAAITNTLIFDEQEMIHANVTASLELFRRMAEGGCNRFVYASSTAVYGNSPAPYREEGPLQPLNSYGRSKKLLDEAAMEFVRTHPEITVVGLRYCNIYGPGENHKGKMASMIFQLARQMKNGAPRLFKHGEQKRDYIYVKDVVRANLCAAVANKSGVYNCGSGNATTFNELVKILNGVMKTSLTPAYFENPRHETYQNHTECDMRLAESELSFVPRFSIRDGIQDYYESGYIA